MKEAIKYSGQNFAPSRCALVIAFLAIALAACGERVSDALQKRKPQFDEKRALFQAIARQIPAAHVAADTAKRLDPKPVYDVKQDDFNTEIVAYEQLLGPDTKPASFDLILTGNLVSGMQWTGPKNPMAESAANERDAKFGQKLDRALAYRWLVVVRPYDVVNPVATSETTFHGGTATFDVFVVDMQTKQIEGQGRFDAKSASSVDYLAKRGESKEARLEDFARSTMFTEARKKLATLLERTTGGTFVFEHN